jgi:predicted RNA-binding Zn-ribbon protein involved in translation (DUF1610 family)
MIHIKCKKCGWRTPFSSNIDGFTAKNRLKEDVLLCPNCGQILIKREKTKRNRSIKH